MNPLKYIRQSLGLKLFLSYLVIIVVGVAVLGTAAQSVAPAAFSRHMAAMTGANVPIPSSPAMDSLFSGFREALAEAVLYAAAASLLAAVSISYFVARRILYPVREMMIASREMVSGRYSRRVTVTGSDELGVLARNFNSMAEALERTEERRQQLVADIAHELRTPLTTIKSHMEGLVDGVIPASNDIFELVNKEAERLTRLVQDLQELSRAEAKQLNMRLQESDVSTLAESAVSRLEPQYEAKGVRLDMCVDDDVPQVLVDEDRIMQVLLNLLGNALQYTPSEGRVLISALRKGAALQVSVADSGVGIPAEHLPHVFERFYRVDKSRSRARGGSGIGLTISRHIVEAHSGRIWAESPGPGQGSTFTFTLPAYSG